MDYTTLIAAKSVAGSIGDWINDSRIVSSAPVIVDESQDWIYNRLRHWRMMPPAVTGVLSTASPLITFPSDMLEPNYLVITGANRTVLNQKSPQEVFEARAYSSGSLTVGIPSMYSFDNTDLFFDTKPDQAYPYALLYYQMPARLSPSNTTNFLTTYCERLMRMVIMMNACEWTKEIGQGQFDRTWYEDQANKEVAAVQANSDRARRMTSGPLVEQERRGVRQPLTRQGAS